MAPWDGFGAARQHLSKLVSSRRYLDNQVFVSLANGELIAYQREAGEAGSVPLGPSRGCSGCLQLHCVPREGYPSRDATPNSQHMDPAHCVPLRTSPAL